MANPRLARSCTLTKLCNHKILFIFDNIWVESNICNPGTIEAYQTATNPKQKVRQINTGTKAIGVRSYHRN